MKRNKAAWRLRSGLSLGAILVVMVAVLAGFDRWSLAHPGSYASLWNRLHRAGLTAYSAQSYHRFATLAYSVREEADPHLPRGVQHVRSPGRPGKLEEWGLRIVDAHGRTVDQKRFRASVVQAPVPAVIARGSSSCINTGGRCYSFNRVLHLTATAYTRAWQDTAPFGLGVSYLGIPVYWGIVAVDPHVVPLGTWLYVENYGLAVAADRGGAIVGRRIDLFMDTDPQDANKFGIQDLTVWVLNDKRLPPVRPRWPVPSSVPLATPRGAQGG